VEIHAAPRDTGRLVVHCQVDARGDVEAAIARVVAARWELLHLERHQATLESVFLHYVGTAPPAGAPA
jgi:hypothetical protein